MSPFDSCSRRAFLGQVGGALAGAALLGSRGRLFAATEAPRLRVAAVLTEFTYRSHAHVILENFLKPYLFNGEWVDPNVTVTAMYVDQFPPGRDMARAVSKEFNIPIYPTIAGALTGGGEKLNVDGVLSIGECFGRATGWRRCSTTSTCRIAGIGRRRCTTRPAR
jgi:hypothetical protein